MKLGAVLILFLLLIPLTSWGIVSVTEEQPLPATQDPPYFYLETNFIDLGEDKSSGKYKIFASSNAIWQVTVEGAAKETLNLSKTAGQGEAEINFSIDRSKAPSGWQDLRLKYSWQADVSGTLIAGSDELFIRFYSPPVHPKEEAPVPEAPVQREKETSVTTPAPEAPIQEEKPITGPTPETQRNWLPLFLASAFVLLVGILGWIFLIPRLKKLRELRSQGVLEVKFNLEAWGLDKYPCDLVVLIDGVNVTGRIPCPAGLKSEILKSFPMTLLANSVHKILIGFIRDNYPLRFNGGWETTFEVSNLPVQSVDISWLRIIPNIHIRPPIPIPIISEEPKEEEQKEEPGEKEEGLPIAEKKRCCKCWLEKVEGTVDVKLNKETKWQSAEKGMELTRESFVSSGFDSKFTIKCIIVEGEKPVIIEATSLTIVEIREICEDDPIKGRIINTDEIKVDVRKGVMKADFKVKTPNITIGVKG